MFKLYYFDAKSFTHLITDAKLICAEKLYMPGERAIWTGSGLTALIFHIDGRLSQYRAVQSPAI